MNHGERGACAMRGRRDTSKRMDAGSRTKNRRLWQHSGTRDSGSNLVCDEREPGRQLGLAELCNLLYQPTGENPVALHQFSSVSTARSVRWLVKPEVEGSNPSRSATFQRGYVEER